MLWLLGALGAIVIGVVAVWLIWKVPPALYSYLPDPKDRANAEASTRTGIIAGLAGLAALGSLTVTARTYRLSLQGQLTDRYTKAVAQLGDDKLDIRLGGIYALERLAVDSKRDHPTVVEVLSAYVRERTRSRAAPRVRPPGRRTAYPLKLTTKLEPLAVDIQAALTVLGRLPTRPRVNRADLSDANLTKADLRNLTLTGANLSGAQLVGAALSNTNLTGANLRGADLTEAHLYKATLTKADLFEADLTKAYFWEADLTEAYLYNATLTEALLGRANLTEADLSDANLTKAGFGEVHLTRARLHSATMTGANLWRADLTEADFWRADLTGAGLHEAVLTGAKQLDQKQLDGACGDEDTRLPAGLARPDSWTAPSPDSPNSAAAPSNPADPNEGEPPPATG
jgi:uncharacterized protein YjbI with pentapeptide repeats